MELSFKISDGWILVKPKFNQRVAPRAWFPKPGIKTKIRPKIEMA